MSYAIGCAKVRSLLDVRSLVARLLAKKLDQRPSSADAAIVEIDDAIASLANAGLESMALRTGATLVPKGSLPAPAMPSARPMPAVPARRSYVERKTARLVAFAQSYGLTPQQLLFGFAIAFGLVALVMVVAMSGS